VNKQSMVYTIIFTFIVCFAFVFLLALTNEATRPMVEFNETVARQKAILSAMNVPFESDQDADSKFRDVEQVEKDGLSLFTTTVDGRRVYAKEFFGSGLWGTINGVLGVDEDVSQTVGLEIISHNETPGLGGRIDESWFKEQLAGEELGDGGIVVTEGDGDTDYSNGEIDGVTGATRTSESMERIINDELEALRSALGGA
jgi:Na+-transporting NADH:ubiquinone oxidoreductase subunit C